ncbi:cytoplasmic 60S subunit biogenesis factor ZNF622-like [Uloborus diversus]|uniref:cytoplasmic 60S subunit biogenesis factor ZNF622-like n=1 Tax=Uloborus diversus TaxID=327109 RepID=UPI0024092C1E|nr:cytoplasmic 60S subunit biogenesis factor ZNF622-like [Uloborus diversus]
MSLTCIACKLLFSVPELHQEHYKSDWHRYNLKRRIAELPPLTEEEFEVKAEAFKANGDESNKKESLRCDSCHKHFSSKNAMDNHMKSKKHLEIKSAEIIQGKKTVALKTPSVAIKTSPPENIPPADDASDDEGWEDEDDGEWESCDEVDENIKTITIDTNDCLFCDHQSDSAENNVAHMTENHSFFIPDIECVKDLDGLIACLAAKIYVHHICLWCNGKGRGFKSVGSVRRHMFDKGHCKMLYEGEALLDYADFYDYSSSDEANEQIDEDALIDLLGDSDFELVLPSGTTLGHRSLSIYYKQNLKPVSSDNEKKVRKIMQQYKALGYTGTSGPAAVKRARDIVFMQKIKNKYNLKLAMKQNKFQPHFRPQVMF